MNNKSSGQELLKYINSLPVSSNGLYDYPNQNVVVPTEGNITMKGINYPVLGISMETGEQQLMQPGGSYDFPDTSNVLEIPQYQNGGTVKNYFLDSVEFEKEYLKGKKIKERLLKAGFKKPERQIDFLKNQLDEVTLNSINDKDESPAYYNPSTNEVFYNKSRKQAYDKDTIPHEIGHIFNDTNKLNEKLIDDRNTFIKEKGWDKFIQKLKLRYDIDASYHTHEGHEAEWGETVADVHAARQELLKKGFDGRFSNFTNDAYDKMREIANTDIGSASARLLNKIGNKKSEEDYYNNVLIKYGNGDNMTEEEMKVVKDYDNFQKRNKDVKKKYIFDIMNKVVSNDYNNGKMNNNQKNDDLLFYAQDGGKIYTQNIDPVVMTNLGNYGIGIDDVNDAIQLQDYEKPGNSTIKNFDDYVLNMYRDWESLDDFDITKSDGHTYIPSQEFGQDLKGKYVDMRLDHFFPNGDNFYNRTYIPENIQDQIDLQRAFKDRRISPLGLNVQYTNTPETVEKQRDFLREMVGSDSYRNLLSNYYPDARQEQLDRLARLDSANINILNQEELSKIDPGIEGVSGRYANDYDRLFNEDSVAKFQRVFPGKEKFNEAHVKTLAKNGYLSDKWTFDDELMAMARDNMDNKGVSILDKPRDNGAIAVHELSHFIKDPNPNQFKDIVDRTKNIQEPARMIPVGNGQYTPVDYYRTPSEIQSRLDVLRYLLKERGIKDTTKDLKVSDKELEKALKDPVIKNNHNVQDLIETSKGSQDLLWLLNNIVNNSSKPGQDLRQYMG